MKGTLVHIITTISICLLSTVSFSQTGEIQVEFIGNCGLHLTDGNSNLYIDFPYKSGAHGYMEFESAELDSIQPNSFFLFTHKHSDHYSKKNLRKVLKEKKGTTYGPWNIDELSQLAASISEFSIQAFKTDHTVFGIPFKHYSYSIQWHGQHIFISGDTTEPETIGTIKDIDWAFVPYWLLKNAKEQGIEIDTKKYAVYHLAKEQTPSARKNWDTVDNIKPLVDQGEVFSISLEKN